MEASGINALIGDKVRPRITEDGILHIDPHAEDGGDAVMLADSGADEYGRRFRAMQPLHGSIGQ